MQNDFLFELGCEELPSAAVSLLSDALLKQVSASLEKAQLSHQSMRSFATPRRLALLIEGLQTEVAPAKIVKRGPAKERAFDPQGNPSPALIGFAHANGVTVDALTVLETDKGVYMVYECDSPALPTASLMPQIIQEALKALPIAKLMRWGAGDYAFVRPVHWCVMLFGEQIIACQIMGVNTGRDSRGHRFHHPDKITIVSPKDYEDALLTGQVVADFSKRRQLIVAQIEQAASLLKARAVMPEALLDEVTSIVEWPKILVAAFDETFLDVPSEALIASMQSHQKCFALRDGQGKLLPRFITVSNIESLCPEQVIAGNEKVMRARLSDAAFFFKQDKKEPLASHIEKTKHVVFQTRLGSLYDKTLRMAQLAQILIAPLGLDKTALKRAIALSRCDLMTGMVGEFPELQGIMGYYYAHHDNESNDVAVALNEQYMPRFSGDQLPTSSLGLVLSLVDRMDTLVGIFAIGERARGVKDPFKLRRHAQAVVRILQNLPASVTLSELIDEAKLAYQGKIPLDNVDELKPFILDRLLSYYQSLGFSADRVASVLAVQDERIEDFDKRIYALQEFLSTDAASALSAACKRVDNILNAAGKVPLAEKVHPELFEVEAEHKLFEALLQLNTQEVGMNYGARLIALANLQSPIDVFFEKVMVMVDDEKIRSNRLVLLSQLQGLLKQVADIALLQVRS